MRGDLKVALFVEGSHAPRPARANPPLHRIWNEHIAGSIGLSAFDPIVPISKKHLVAMDPTAPKMSGAGERLDQLMVRILDRDGFDAAVVAWDLVPAWNPNAEFCRWNETLDLYRLLADSQVLPDDWCGEARSRHRALIERCSPGDRGDALDLRAGMVLAVCMEPMFESLLVQSEQAVKRALDLTGQRTPGGWPTGVWGRCAQHPDSDILAPAIGSLRRVRPRLPITKQIPGDFRTNKDGWGEYLLRKMLEAPQDNQTVRAHPIYQRLAEWLI